MNTLYDQFVQRVVSAAKASALCGRIAAECTIFKTASEIAMTHDLTPTMIDQLYADAFSALSKLRFPKMPIPQFTEAQLCCMNN